MLMKQTRCVIRPQRIVPSQSASRHTALESQNRFIGAAFSSAVEDELAHARMAWREFQSTRERDAVYAFLSAVFEIVQRWKKERRAKAGSLQALAATKHPGAIRKPEPFAIVIFCTSDPLTVDSRTRNKWARALRYVERFKPNIQGLAQFVKAQGGINECVAQFSDRPK